MFAGYTHFMLRVLQQSRFHGKQHQGMVKTFSNRLRYAVSVGGFVVAFQAYYGMLRYLCERQRIFDAATSRSLLPESLASATRPSPKSGQHHNVSIGQFPSVITVGNDDDDDDTELPLCTRDVVSNGKWVSRELAKPPYISRNKHLRCFPDEVYEQSPWRTWAWKPFNETCIFSEWNSEQFCQLMNKASISIIGDSLSWEQYSSLLQLLGQKVRQTDQHKSKSENRNHIQTACNMSTRIVFRNDPRLTLISDSIRDDFPLAIVLNRGAHWVNDTELKHGIQKNVEELRAWQHTCRRMGLRCHLFWRTTVPGHPRCTVLNETEPFNDFAAMERRILDVNNYDNVTINYHWHDFARQNELILQELEASGLDYSVIDGYHLNILRPDGHRTHTGDCLHNCYPGKMDVYNQLLLHFLRMERSPADVQYLVQQYERAQQRQQLQHEQQQLEATA